MKISIVCVGCLLISLCVKAQAIIEPQMVRIEGGTFQMGSSTGYNDGISLKKPQHMVTLSRFMMAKYPVTVREFAAFIAATNYVTDAQKAGRSVVIKIGSWWEFRNNVNWMDDEEGNRRKESDWNRPVIHVSWNDATAYCEWLSSNTSRNYSLPTEAQWEYAAGNGVKHTTYSWGNNLPVAGCKVGNIYDENAFSIFKTYENQTLRYKGYYDGYVFSSPVGSFTANELGLYDMSGNVFQWCSDWYDKEYYSVSPVYDPPGPNNGTDRVFRGTSWASFLYPITYRCCNEPNLPNNDIGFRVVSSW